MSERMLAATLIFATGLAGGGRCDADDREPELPVDASIDGAILNRVHFVANAGQWADESIRYALKVGGLSITFRQSSFRIHAVQSVDVTGAPDSTNRPEQASPENAPAELEATFPGSNAVDPQGADPRAARLHYYTSAEERERRRDVPTFGALVYPHIYDGVDLCVAPHPSGVLKYEFRVARGADWSQIEVAVGDRARLRSDDSGDLHIETSFGTLVDGESRFRRRQPALHAVLRRDRR